MSKAFVSLMGVKGGPAIRPGSNMPTSILVEIAGKRILVDAGLGATRGICDQGLFLPEIDVVLITHMHSDHYLELGPFFHTAWTAGLKRPVPVVGPSALREYWTHFCASMAFDIDLRMADEGRVPFAPLCALSVMKEGAIWQEDALTITAMKNDHPPIEESYALRFEAADKRIVLSGDTAFMPQMIEFARGADLLVHECMLPAGVEALVARTPNGDERLTAHILRSHTCAIDVGRLAAGAQVKALALNHFVPDGDPDFPPERFADDVRQNWSGPLHLGKDGLRIAI